MSHVVKGKSVGAEEGWGRPSEEFSNIFSTSCLKGGGVPSELESFVLVGGL